jgi:hypothetical protein
MFFTWIGIVVVASHIMLYRYKIDKYEKEQAALLDKTTSSAVTDANAGNNGNPEMSESNFHHWSRPALERAALPALPALPEDSQEGSPVKL